MIQVSKYCLVLLSVLCGTSAQATNWYTFSEAIATNALYFFDLDTVIKQGRSVTIWSKYVNDRQKPDSDGSYATAQKITFTCDKRTTQVFTTVIYDINGKFIKTFPNPTAVQDVKPGSVIEEMVKAVCAPDFPKNTSGELYFQVTGGDIFTHAANYFDAKRAQTTDPAPN